jgi:hypothetical protein
MEHLPRPIKMSYHVYLVAGLEIFHKHLSQPRSSVRYEFAVSESIDTLSQH